MSSLSISLALDTDEPGQTATEDAAALIGDIFLDWGTPRLPGEPEAHALAAAQRAYDYEALLHCALEAAEEHGADFTDRIAQSDQTLVLLWEYMEDLRRTLRPTIYSSATNADEYIAAQQALDEPLPEPKPGLDFAAIKRTVDIVEYIQRDTVLRQKGNKWYGRCPFPDHSDSSASFWVYPDTRSFYCFGCRRGGDVIDYAKHKGLKASQM